MISALALFGPIGTWELILILVVVGIVYAMLRGRGDPTSGRGSR